VNSLRELMQYGKARSGQISFGSAGVGTPSYIAMLLIARAGSFEMISVPFKGGNDVIVAALGGHIPVAIGTFSTALPHIKSGKLRALGITESKRLSLAPDLPTIAESGLPGFEVSQWFGVFAPAGIPPAVTQKIGAETGAILALLDTKTRFDSLGMEIAYAGPAEFAAYVKADLAKWIKQIKELGMQEKPH
jgi:tripartite-type tricarboxylate transporter receptor subunit TctC